MVKHVPVRIDPPNKNTLIPIDYIECRCVSGEWTVITPLLGTIFTNETEELVCRLYDLRRDQWWNCGTIRGRIRDRILVAYHKHRTNPSTSIEWFRRIP